MLRCTTDGDYLGTVTTLVYSSPHGPSVKASLDPLPCDSTLLPASLSKHSVSTSLPHLDTTSFLDTTTLIHPSNSTALSSHKSQPCIPQAIPSLLLHKSISSSTETSFDSYQPHTKHNQQHVFTARFRRGQSRPQEARRRAGHVPVLPRVLEHVVPEGGQGRPQAHVHLPYLPTHRRGHLQLHLP